MKSSQALMGRGGASGRALMSSPLRWKPSSGAQNGTRTEPVVHLPGADAKWQRHVMTTLWLTLGFFLIVVTVLVFAQAHGWLGSAGGGLPYFPSWPENWP